MAVCGECDSLDTSYSQLLISYWFYSFIVFKGDKVSMLAHTYPHKALRKIVAISNHQADSPFYAWPDV